MPTSLHLNIAASARDALASYALGVTAREGFNGKLQDVVVERENLSQYLLLDVDAGTELVTSPLASGVLSMQQLINGRYMGLEPGYGKPSTEKYKDWVNNKEEIEVWSALKEIRQHPENFIDSRMRREQTALFASLMNELLQGELTSELAVSALVNYLYKFDTLANIIPLNGYVDGYSERGATLYILGRTSSATKKYYFRSAEIEFVTDKDQHKRALMKWGEWIPIECPIENALEGSVRILHFIGRTMVVWAESHITKRDADHTFTNIVLKCSYAQINKAWSPPMSIGPERGLLPKDVDGPVEEYYSGLETIAVSLGRDYCCIGVVALESAPAMAGKQKVVEDAKSALDRAKQRYEAASNAIRPFASLGWMVPEQALEPLRNELGAAEAEIKRYTQELEAAVKEVEGHSVAVTLLVDAAFQYRTLDSLDAYPNVGRYLERALQGKLFFQAAQESGFAVFVEGGGTQSSIESLDIAPLVVGKTVFLSDDKKTITVSLPFRIYRQPNEDLHCEKMLSTGEDMVWEPVAQTEDWGISGAFQHTFTLQGDSAAASFPLMLRIKCVSILPGINRTIEFNWRGNILYKAGGFSSDIGRTIAEPVIDSVSYDGTTGYFLVWADKAFSINVRLNTTFGKKLISIANASVTDLFAAESRAWLEPSYSPETPAERMDFYGANGIYLWEIFCYIPILISGLFRDVGKFEEAKDWFHYVFAPSSQNPWQFDILNFPRKEWEQTYLVTDNSDPHQLALANPVVYKLAYFQQYIQLLIDEGDRAYRHLTRDSLGRAMISYWLASALLGDVSASTYVSHYDDTVTLKQAAERPDTDLRATERAVARMIAEHPAYAAISAGAATSGESASGSGSSVAATLFEPQTLASSVNRPPLESAGLYGTDPNHIELADAHPLSYIRSTRDPMLLSEDIGGFIIPVNTVLVSMRSVLNERFHNLRHGLSIDGKVISLPLFAPPLNPRDLLAARFMHGFDEAAEEIGVQDAVPPYRFRTMLNQAYGSVDMLRGYGAQLQGWLEAKDRCAEQALDMAKLIEVSDILIAQQKLSVDAAAKTVEKLTLAASAADFRRSYYAQLYDENLNGFEATSVACRSVLSVSNAIMNASWFMEGALSLAPRQFGMVVDTGKGPAHIPNTLGKLARGAVLYSSIMADAMDTASTYIRRREEWAFQRDMARMDIEQIEQELAVQRILLQAAEKSLAQAQAERSHTLKTHQFMMTGRFSNDALYSWLCSRMGVLYRQAYDLAIAQCLAAEACWRFELGDYETPSFFNSLSRWSGRGLLVGEGLNLDLHRLEADFTLRNDRKNEVSVSFPLKDLVGSESAWSNGLSAGVFRFSITERDLSKVMPGQFLRKIKSVSLVTGTHPGERHAILTQIKNQTLLKGTADSIEAWKRLCDGDATMDTTLVKTNLRLGDPVTLSLVKASNMEFIETTDVRDYERDERYFPFEGTGAVSSWALQFLNPQDPEMRDYFKQIKEGSIKLEFAITFTGRFGDRGFRTEVERYLAASRRPDAE